MQKTNRVFITIALVAMCFTFALSAAAKGSVEVTISVAKQAFTENEGVLVDVTFTNTSNGVAKVLKWYTPFDGVEESLFKVTRDGVPVQYLGAHYKRPQPEDRDFIILKSGKSLTKTVDLADYYDFSVSGQYEIIYDVASLNLHEKNNGQLKKVERLTSNNTSAKVDGRASKRPPPQPPTGGNLNNFSACTTTQQTSTVDARTKAAEYSSNSLNYLLSNAVTERYTTWFSAYTSARYDTVESNFAKIKTAMDSASMTFNCGCKQRYYAYVYPNEPYTIYLCTYFWQAPLEGTDSKAGTLVRETSHFTVVAGTDDWVYGQAGAKNLAITDPNKAINNADSHEYFAENTPYQP